MNNGWTLNTTLSIETGIKDYYTKISPPIIRLNVYNKGIGWMWEINMLGTRKSRRLFEDKMDCMNECEEEAQALLKTVFLELWGVNLC